MPVPIIVDAPPMASGASHHCRNPGPRRELGLAADSETPLGLRQGHPSQDAAGYQTFSQDMTGMGPQVIAGPPA